MEVFVIVKTKLILIFNFVTLSGCLNQLDSPSSPALLLSQLSNQGSGGGKAGTLTVGSPSYSPTNQAVADGTVVTISSAAGSTVYYTVDGSTPTISGPSGLSPVTVNLTGVQGTHVFLKAFSVDPTGATSGISTEDYVIAAQTVVNPVFFPTNQAVSSGTQITITSNSGSTIYYTMDGTAPTTSSPSGPSPLTVALVGSNGTHLYIHAMADLPSVGTSDVMMEDYVVAH